MEQRFKDREEAGRALAERLGRYARKEAAVVCALPRGGVPVGAVVAARLGLPLDLLIPRKIGHPADPEFAVAAVTEKGEPVVAEAEKRGAEEAWFAAAVRRARAEAERRRKAYLPDGRQRPLKGAIVIIVDDGVATGLTARAAIREARARGASRVVVAVPFAPKDGLDTLSSEADEVVTVFVPEEPLGSVGAYYEDFPQLTDDEVLHYMRSLP